MPQKFCRILKSDLKIADMRSFTCTKIPNNINYTDIQEEISNSMDMLSHSQRSKISFKSPNLKQYYAIISLFPRKKNK